MTPENAFRYRLTIMKLLNNERTALVIIDVQEKFMPAISQGDRVVENIVRFIELAKLYDLPIILTEQNPEGIGTTIPGIKDLLPVYDPIIKYHFNGCDVDEFNERIDSKNLENIIVTGVETHICIFQTSVSLLDKDYHVQIPRDAVGSRTDENRSIGLALLKQAGGVITSTETIIFQLLKRAGTDPFRHMLKFIK